MAASGWFSSCAMEEAISPIVTSRAVDHRVAEIRRVLGEDAAAASYVETVPGLGYRFVHPVERG